MTIHHDKMSYGRLASSREELSEEKIAEMLGRLSADGGDGKSEKSPDDGRTGSDGEDDLHGDAVRRGKKQ